MSIPISSGCPTPAVDFAFGGRFLDDGRIPVNGTVAFNRSDGRVLESTCNVRDDRDSNDGVWSTSFVCPNLTGRAHF